MAKTKKRKKIVLKNDGSPDLRSTRVFKSHTDLAKTRMSLVAHKKRFINAYGKLLELGMTEMMIENIFGLSHGLRRASSDPEFQAEYDEAMSTMEVQLSAQMIVQAIGYDYEEEKVTYIRAKENTDPDTVEGGWVAVRKEKFLKHHPGNAQSFMNFMTNKFPDKWKNSRETVVKEEGYDSSPSERNRKQIVSLARDVLEANTDETEREHQLQT